MQDVKFRSVSLPDDLPRVHELFAAGMHFYTDQLDPQLHGKLKKNWEEYILNAMKDDLANISSVYLEGGGFWVAVDTATNQIVGIVGAEKKTASVVELRRMSVCMESRKIGLASGLIRVVEDFARMNCFNEVMLTTGHTMFPAVRLYQSNGYSRYNEKHSVLFRKLVSHYDKPRPRL
jgi:GNAT superfamily N-acetyltransferase